MRKVKVLGEGRVLEVRKYFLPERLDYYNTVQVVINDINNYGGPDLKSAVDLILKNGELIMAPHVIDCKSAQTFLMQYNNLLKISCDNCKHDSSLSQDSTVSNFYFCKLEDKEYVEECSLDSDVFFTDKVKNCKKNKKCEDFENRELPEDALPISEIVKQLL